MSECCRTGSPEQSTLPATTCPSCGTTGPAVTDATVWAMATLSVPAAALAGTGYRSCRNPACSVVYYGPQTAIERAGVRVAVNFKDPGPDVPLCYCFGHTRRSIAEEVDATGRSTASAVIAAEIKAGRCACEAKNPSGRCCLGEVRAYEKLMVQRHSA